MRSSLTLLLSAVAATGVLSAEAPIPGYGVEVLQWDIEVAVGRTEVLNGTVQEVYAQALQINPKFTLTNAAEARDVHQKQKRSSVQCGNWPLADKGRIQEGINYLRGAPAAPRNGPGPGNCGRVSCSYNSAIWWCNDNTTPKTLDSWNWVADSAQHIVNTCAPAAARVSGQNFESGNWNTIVRGDSC
ncbi:hypothetical protein H634G_03296 [Metarhizium anisopliae BRIP 53293]|uniref:SCP domain-containing protein n=1 Tax=Metarhizium anisopliae BRIP 53293 TaxID=1291518 RepID=A0A0D9P4R7_METAN|nr:hypothetical protein H634G_03296 [Metarhizium anisopliae BRIP 53293]KJK90282.1 hypothetical protein H633G_05849 [Metarhizium anisopliae BRIP 53284]